MIPIAISAITTPLSGVASARLLLIRLWPRKEIVDVARSIGVHRVVLSSIIIIRHSEIIRWGPEVDARSERGYSV